MASPNLRLTIACLLFFLLVPVSGQLRGISGNMARCKTSSEVVNFWEGSTSEDSDFYVQIRVTPQDCHGYCRGLIRYKIRYQSASGRQHWERSNVEWRCDTDRETSVEVIDGCEASGCDQEENRCRILTVVITEVSCFD